MTNTSGTNASGAMDILSTLLLSPAVDRSSPVVSRLQELNLQEFKSLIELAHSNHVIIRGMNVYRSLIQEPTREQAVEDIISAEQLRISKAMASLRQICDAFESAGLDLMVIKTLDHWPDFGSDIDLYTNDEPRVVCEFMQNKFGATIASRSWGDCLAGKWNFEIPGLSESVEIHMQRLGQTGEQLTLAKSVATRARVRQFGEYNFRAASASDRIMISTLQRMYRHFYFRLCDIVDSAALVILGDIDWEDLQRSGRACGIWEGTATYLVLVSDYVKRYCGSGIGLPRFVIESACFDGSVMYFRQGYLRVPILPESVRLFGSQLMGSLRRGEIHNSARLSILPWLATAAAIGQKVTGSDKGIW